MTGSIRRALALALGALAVIAFGTVVPVADAGESPVDELGRLRSEDAVLEARIAGLETWLVDGQRRLETLDEDIRRAEAEVDAAERRVLLADQAVERQTEAVRERAVAAYVNPVGLADAPLDEDVNEAATQHLLVSQVAEYDREVLDAKTAAERRARDVREEAAGRQADLDETKRSLTDLLDELFARRDEVTTAQEALEARIEVVQAEVDAMEAAQTDLASLIDGLSDPSGEPVGRLLLPVDGTLTSRFGPRWGRLHAGIDIAAPTGAPIRAAADGTVIYSDWMSGYGNVVIVDHGGGLTTLYAHQSRRGVGAGDRLEQGAVLGAVGSTGNSTGAHLHFEVRESGVPTDPMPYLTA